MSGTTEAVRRWEAADLIGGEDHDFVVNLYLALLRRWPDPEGYRRYLDQIAGRPERRIPALREIAASEEARQAGVQVAFEGPGLPPAPSRAIAVALAIRTEWLREEVERLRASEAALRQEVAELGATRLAAELIEGRDAALHFEINALRREVAERLDGLALPGDGETAVRAVASLVADYAGDLVAAAEARMEHRLRAVEARLFALGARQNA